MPDTPRPDFNDTQPPMRPAEPEPRVVKVDKRGSRHWFFTLLAYMPFVVAGAVYGVAMHRLFSGLLSREAAQSSGLMLWSFLFGVPLAIGFLVSFLATRRKRAGLAGAGLLSWLSTGLFVFAGGALLREGSICILMALPLLLILAVLGALVGALASAFSKDQGPKLLSVALLLPLALGSVEAGLDEPTDGQHIVRSVLIQAPAETVWQHINFPLDIDPAELKDGIAYRMGVPFPVEARTLQGRIGGQRALVWQRGVRFNEIITDWQPNRYIAWRYDFAPDSFPPGSLDDHVVIGGRYFSLDDTAYALTPEAGGTRLTITVNTHVSTHFNWYAGWWANWLVADTAEAILKFYKRRAERG
ncbi:SRPBCC family protein [Roseateles sp. NT4]|uniref:SRPBCC family protein n=1 Tax=Roseateles sp. NT4 TaxID=3453715 RepID=UPI003EEEBC52